MSRITPLHPKRPLRRRLVIGGAAIVLWVRETAAGPEMAFAPPGIRHRKLRWRRVADVIGNAFAVDVGLLFGQQLEISQEIGHAPPPPTS